MEMDNTMKMRVIHKDRGCHNCSHFKHISERVQPSGHISETGRCTASAPWAFTPNDNLDYGNLLLTWKNGGKATLTSIYAETCYMQLGTCIAWKAKRIPKPRVIKEIKNNFVIKDEPKKPSIIEKVVGDARKRFGEIVFRGEDENLSGAENVDTKNKEE